MPDDRLPFAVQSDDADRRHLCGWIDAPERHVVAKSMPVICQAMEDLQPQPDKLCRLYMLWGHLFSGPPDYPAQEIGDCCSFGWGHGHDLLQCVHVYKGQMDINSVHRTCTEAYYSAGREAGNMLGRSDGCYGSAMAKASLSLGVINYGQLPSSAGPQSYSGQRAKSWGLSGMPRDVREIASHYKLGGAALIESTDEMIAAIQAGKPCPICSRLGFTKTRDKLGFCEPQGQWGHCMCCVGYRPASTGRAGFCIIQSWGPGEPQGPTDLEQPSWSFWIGVDVMRKIIGERDSFAMSDTPGFDPVKLPPEVLQGA